MGARLLKRTTCVDLSDNSSEAEDYPVDNDDRYMNEAYDRDSNEGGSRNENEEYDYVADEEPENETSQRDE